MNIQNIDADVDFLCGSTSATYPLADKRRNMNIAYQDVARLIWESDGTWSFDDANNTDLPVAYRTMGHNSGTYLIPTTAQRVEQVEVKDANANWTKLKPIGYHDLSISPEEYLTGGGTPLYYLLDGTQIRLFPAPVSGAATLSSGLAVRLSRNVTEFAVTATTTSPGFAEPFHRILSYAMAIDFVRDDQDRQFLAIQKDRLQRGMATFYSKRGAEYKTRVKPAGLKRWRQYT